MKKEDLKTGMVVKTREGTIFEVLRDTPNEYYSHILRGKSRWAALDWYNDDLTYNHDGESCWDIVEIYKTNVCTSNINTFPNNYKLIWKREQEKFYLKHKWLLGYLNYEDNLDKFTLDTKTYSPYLQTQFTLEEIENIERELNTTLNDFILIPVED